MAKAPHTLNPDSLELQPKRLQIEEVKDSLTITDGKFKLKIYFIGQKSEHTNDYLIYYFPSEKLQVKSYYMKTTWFGLQERVRLKKRAEDKQAYITPLKNLV